MDSDAPLTTKLALIVTLKLENDSIPCCVTGTGALYYYGAPRLIDVCPPSA